MEIIITPKDRKRMLKYTNALNDLRNDTSEHCPISYDTIRELSNLLYDLKELLDFEQPWCEHGGRSWWEDFEYKEDIPDKLSETNEIMQ